MAKSLTERFWSKVDKGPKENDCWIWMGAYNEGGYGRFRFPNGKYMLAHRISFIASGRAIPEGHLVCHTCDHPFCVNPAHLFTGTHKDNSQDMVVKGRSMKGRSVKRLSPEQVFEILDIYGFGCRPMSDLARDYDVSVRRISNIVNRRSKIDFPVGANVNG